MSKEMFNKKTEVGVGLVSPCAACKLLRRRCALDCVFSPYFPATEPYKFANVHRIFGASNVSKLLREIPVEQRADAASSLVFEANARVQDPVYGCVGAISSLQHQIDILHAQLAVAQAEMIRIRLHHAAYFSNSTAATAATIIMTSDASSCTLVRLPMINPCEGCNTYNCKFDQQHEHSNSNLSSHNQVDLTSVSR